MQIFRERQSNNAAIKPSVQPLYIAASAADRFHAAKICSHKHYTQQHQKENLQRNKNRITKIASNSGFTLHASRDQC
jgi:hypothetical protein